MEAKQTATMSTSDLRDEIVALSEEASHDIPNSAREELLDRIDDLRLELVSRQIRREKVAR